MAIKPQFFNLRGTSSVFPPGVGTPGKGFSITYGKGHPSSGWSVSGSAAFAGGVVNGSYDGRRALIEGGAGIPGLQAGAQYTTRLTKCTFTGCGKSKTHKKDTKYLKDLRSGKLKQNYNKRQPQKRKR